MKIHCEGDAGSIRQLFLPICECKFNKKYANPDFFDYFCL